MKNALLLLIIFSFCKSYSQNSKEAKFNKKGFAVQIGTGLIYGGVGTLFEYQLKLNDKLKMTPILGVGLSIGGPPDQTDTIHSEGIWLNSAIGLNLEYGKKHRLIIGPQLITAYYTSEISPQSSKQRMFAGYSFITGYKGTASFGLIWQVYLGLAHMEDPLMTGKNHYLMPHFGAGLGYKF